MKLAKWAKESFEIICKYEHEYIYLSDNSKKLCKIPHIQAYSTNLNGIIFGIPGSY